jgi:GAF domain-containing protein
MGCVRSGQDPDVAVDDEALAALASLAGVVLEYQDLPTTLNAICAIATRSIAAADGASMTSFSEKGPTAIASTDAWAKSLDETQYEEHEGPCFDAARSGVLFRVRDTAAEPRWPSYMPRAVELGVRSMVSIPMTSESKVIGALNVYSKAPDAFDPEAVALAELMAGHASLASQVAMSLFRHRDLARQLQEALDSRVVIEQAKGVVMATTKCTPDAAFQTLVRQSQTRNRKLRDIAAELVAQQSQRP